MTVRPEQEIIPEAEYPRHSLENLHQLTLRHSDMDGGVSYQFEDGSELLDFIIINSRREDQGLRFTNPVLEAEFSFINSSLDRTLPAEQYEIIRQRFPLSQLNHDIVTHHKSRSRSFESKVKLEDIRAKVAATTLESLGSNYGFSRQAKRLGLVVGKAVDEKKDFRTKSLLEDFRRSFEALDPSIDVWLKLSGYEGRTYSAQLAGFTIHGSNGETAVEPVVFSADGEVGTIPEETYINPTVQLRVNPSLVKPAA